MLPSEADSIPVPKRGSVARRGPCSTHRRTIPPNRWHGVALTNMASVQEVARHKCNALWDSADGPIYDTATRDVLDRVIEGCSIHCENPHRRFEEMTAPGCSSHDREPYR
jgi:hypothetical protein